LIAQVVLPFFLKRLIIEGFDAGHFGSSAHQEAESDPKTSCVAIRFCFTSILSFLQS
jgi:hypothetical protein